MQLTRLLDYYHAALWVNGAWTVKPEKREKTTLEQLFANISVTDEDDD